MVFIVKNPEMAKIMIQPYLDKLLLMSLAIEQSEESEAIIEIGKYLLNIFIKDGSGSKFVSGGAVRTRSMAKKVHDTSLHLQPVLSYDKVQRPLRADSPPIRSQRLFYILMALLCVQFFLLSSHQSRFQRNLELIIISTTFQAFALLPAPSFIPIQPSKQQHLKLSLTTSILDSLMFSMLSVYIHKSNKDTPVSFSNQEPEVVFESVVEPTENHDTARLLKLPTPVVWRNKLLLPAYRQMTLPETERIFTTYQSWQANEMNQFQELLSSLFRRTHTDACVTAPYTFGGPTVTCRGDRCFSYLKKCMKDVSKRVSFIPIRFTYDQGDVAGHASIILVNQIKREVELYDPNGLLGNHSKSYLTFISTIMKVAEVNEYTFVGQVSFGLQLLDLLYDGRFAGMCFMYSVWFMDVRLLNLDKSPREIDRLLLDFVATQPLVIYGYLAERMHLYHNAGMYYQTLDSALSIEPTTSRGHTDVLELLESGLRNKYRRVHQRAIRRLENSSDDLLNTLVKVISRSDLDSII